MCKALSRAAARCRRKRFHPIQYRQAADRRRRACRPPRRATADAHPSAALRGRRGRGVFAGPFRQKGREARGNQPAAGCDFRGRDRGARPRGVPGVADREAALQEGGAPRRGEPDGGATARPVTGAFLRSLKHAAWKAHFRRVTTAERLPKLVVQLVCLHVGNIPPDAASRRVGSPAAIAMLGPLTQGPTS